MWGKRPLFQTTAISSLQLWTEKIKMYFCPNHAASSCHTAVLLRKCGRGDNHPPTLVFLYNFSEDDKPCCHSYFLLSGSKAQKPLTLQGCPSLTFSPAHACRAVYTSDHAWFFLAAMRILHHMASVTSAMQLRPLCTDRLLPGLALHPVLADGLCWSSLLGSAHLL